MGESKLSNPLVHVIMADGTEWDAQCLNMDLLKYERTAVKHKWPKPEDSPVWWLTFLAWSAGSRGGQLAAGTTWEAFSQELCAEVSNAAQRDARNGTDGAVEVPPTVQAVGTG